MSTEEENSIVESTPRFDGALAQRFRSAVQSLRVAGVTPSDIVIRSEGLDDLFGNDVAGGVDAFMDKMAGGDILGDDRAEARQLINEIDSLDPEVQAQLSSERNQLLIALKSGDARGIDASTIRQAIDSAKAEVDGQKAMDAAQEREKLMGNIHRLDKVMDDADKKLNAAGYRDREYEEKLKDMERQLSQLEEGSPEWLAKKKEIALFRQEHYGNVEQIARSRNDVPSAQTAQTAGQAAQQQVEDIGRMLTLPTAKEARRSAENQIDDIAELSQRQAMQQRVAPAQSTTELGVIIDPPAPAQKPEIATATPISFSGFDDTTPATRTAETQTKTNDKPALPATAIAANFGGFDEPLPTASQPTTANIAADAKAAVAPSVVANFSGFDDVESHDSQTVNDMRPKNAAIKKA